MIGQTGLKDLVAYTPWEARQGDGATFLYEVVDLATNGKLDITVQHKNYEQADSAASSAGTFTQLASVGTHTLNIGSDLKELVRMKLEFKGTAASDWLHGRALPTSWETN